MRIPLLLLIAVYLAQTDPICPASDGSSTPTLVKLSQLPTKKNNDYTYSISNYANSVDIIRNDNGTFLLGDFSTLRLYSQRSEYRYVSRSLSFKYPPQHRIAELNN